MRLFMQMHEKHSQQGSILMQLIPSHFQTQHDTLSAPYPNDNAISCKLATLF